MDAYNRKITVEMFATDNPLEFGVTIGVILQCRTAVEMGENTRQGGSLDNDWHWEFCDDRDNLDIKEQMTFTWKTFYVNHKWTTQKLRQKINEHVKTCKQWLKYELKRVHVNNLKIMVESHALYVWE